MTEGRRRGGYVLCFCIGLVLLLCLGACRKADDSVVTAGVTLTPAGIAQTTSTPTHTPTPLPPTPSPTATTSSSPTATSVPTATPSPTSTPTPSTTPSPQPTATLAALANGGIPEVVYQTGGMSKAMAIVDDLLYVAVGPRLRVFQLNGLDEPTFLAQSEILADVIEDVVVLDGVAYVVVGRGGLLLIDVATPTAPQTISQLTTFSAPATHVAAQDGVAYVVTTEGNSGELWVVDVGDVSRPGVLSSLPLPLSIDDLIVHNDFAYLTHDRDADQDLAGGLYVIDLANPSLPQLRQDVSARTDGYRIPISLTDDTLYMSTLAGEIIQVDVNTPLQLLFARNRSFGVILGQLATTEFAAFRMYGLGEFGHCHLDVQVLNFSDEADLSFPRNGFELTGCPRDLLARDYYGYVLHSNSLSIIDATEPGQPVLAGTWSIAELGEDVTDVVSHSSGIYVETAYENDVTLIDIADFQTLPTIINQHFFKPYREGTNGLHLIGDTLHLWEEHGAYFVLSLLNGSLEEVYRSNRDDLYASFILSGVEPYAYRTVASVEHVGLEMLDLSNPADPNVIGELMFDSCFASDLALIQAVSDLTIVDTTMYMVGSCVDYKYEIITGTLQFLDVSVPAQPTHMHLTTMPYYSIGSLDLALPYAVLQVHDCPPPYCDSEDESIVVWDVSDLSAPELLGEMLMPDDIEDVVVAGEYIYVAMRDVGIYVVSMADPSNLVVVGQVTLPGRVRALHLHNGYIYVAAEEAGLYILR